MEARRSLEANYSPRAFCADVRHRRSPLQVSKRTAVYFLPRRSGGILR